MTALWLALLAYGVAMWVIAPATSLVQSFIAGKDRSGREPGLAMLTSSIVVAWIFSKSITNSANLGRSYGLLGGVGYAVYYIGIPLCGWVIIRLRKQTGATSLADYLERTYGALAARLFMAIVLLRLFNEVWSNTAVVGSYFGPAGSVQFIGSSLVFTLLVLLYTLKGGLRASLVTDMIQFALLSAAVLFTIGWTLPRVSTLALGAQKPGLWNSGIDFLLLAAIQCVPYPFHDPVLTDRAFISDSRTTMRSYILAGIIAGSIIILFSLVGIVSRQIGSNSNLDAPAQLATAGGGAVLALMSVVMMLSGGSTIDSTFSSTSRAVVVDLGVSRRPVLSGRIAMIAMAVLGNIPMVFGAQLIKATTVSGAMVLGLAPIFLFPSTTRRSPAAFLVPVGISVVGGIVSAFWPALLPWKIGTGEFGSALAWNVVITIACWISFAALFPARHAVCRKSAVAVADEA